LLTRRRLSDRNHLLRRVGQPQGRRRPDRLHPLGYAGAYTDPDGLLYLVNRYYDPQTGQFNFQMGRFSPPGTVEIPGLRPELYGRPNQPDGQKGQTQGPWNPAHPARQPGR
jgi:RHS repeat-associated protein